MNLNTKHLALALFLVATFLAAASLTGCTTVSDAHMRADRSVYAVNAPRARAAGMTPDDDLTWRIAAGVTSTASPGGPDDPALEPGGVFRGAPKAGPGPAGTVR